MVKNNSCCNYLDLRGTPCPLNYVRCSLALESLKIDEYLKVEIDKGEPEEMVISGLSKAGHSVKIVDQKKDTLTLIVNRFGS